MTRQKFKPSLWRLMKFSRATSSAPHAFLLTPYAPRRRHIKMYHLFFLTSQLNGLGNCVHFASDGIDVALEWMQQTLRNIEKIPRIEQQF